MTASWPVTGIGAPVTPDEFDSAYLSYWRERARHELVLGSIKASLAEQPSKAAVRACTRQWIAELLATAEAVAKNMERK